MPVKIPKPPGMDKVKIPTPPGLETPPQTPHQMVPPPPQEPMTDKITGGAVWGAVDENQINLGTILVTLGHFCRIMGVNPVTVGKMIKPVKPAKIEGSHALYLLTDIVQVRDYRDNPQLTTPMAKRVGGPKDFTGDEPPEGCTPAELKTFYQAKQAEQAYIKTKNDNELNSGELLLKADVEKTLIDGFKIVAHYLDNLGDILERDGVITHAEVDAVDRSVDSIREQLAAALREMTSGGVDDL